MPSDDNTSGDQPALITQNLITQITRTWDLIRADHPELPSVVFTLGDGTTKAGQLKMGHFLPNGWAQAGSGETVHEVFIGGEGLRHGAAELLDTLLHEAAHALAHSRGVKDTSRGGRYHNRRYKQIAEELGLDCTEDARIGWSNTALTDTTRDRYDQVLDDLEVAITAHRIQRPTGNGRATSNNGHSLTCECPRKIRASTKTLEAGPIICGVCVTPFTEAGDPNRQARILALQASLAASIPNSTVSAAHTPAL